MGKIRLVEDVCYVFKLPSLISVSYKPIKTKEKYVKAWLKVWRKRWNSGQQ